METTKSHFKAFTVLGYGEFWIENVNLVSLFLDTLKYWVALHALLVRSKLADCLKSGMLTIGLWHAWYFLKMTPCWYLVLKMDLSEFGLSSSTWNSSLSQKNFSYQCLLTFMRIYSSANHYGICYAACHGSGYLMIWEAWKPKIFIYTVLQSTLCVWLMLWLVMEGAMQLYCQLQRTGPVRFVSLFFVAVLY